MIQRIQSIFLLLAALCFGLLFILPLFKSGVATQGMLDDHLYQVNDNNILLIMAAVGTLLALGSIFLFNNRKLQANLAYLVSLIGLALGISSFFLIKPELNEIAQQGISGMQFGSVLPILAIVCSILAGVFIRKDENLVRSSDRLR